MTLHPELAAPLIDQQAISIRLWIQVRWSPRICRLNSCLAEVPNLGRCHAGPTLSGGVGLGHEEGHAFASLTEATSEPSQAPGKDSSFQDL